MCWLVEEVELKDAKPFDYCNGLSTGAKADEDLGNKNWRNVIHRNVDYTKHEIHRTLQTDVIPADNYRIQILCWISLLHKSIINPHDVGKLISLLDTTAPRFITRIKTRKDIMKMPSISPVSFATIGIFPKQNWISFGWKNILTKKLVSEFWQIFRF